MNRIFSISNKWFFQETPWYVKLTMLIYVNGDYIFLLPIILSIFVSFFFSVKIGLLMAGIYIFLRFFGEMLYWLSHQFSDRRYRPHSFGFKNLDNHALFILYQTFSLLGMMIGAIVVCAALLLL